MDKNNNEFEYNGARCFNINVPNIGPAKAVYYDVKALKKIMQYMKVFAQASRGGGPRMKGQLLLMKEDLN